MSNRYDHFITTKELIPPMGDLKFASKVTIHEIGVGEVSHGLGESWGHTSSEAEEKMRERVEEWLSDHER